MRYKLICLLLIGAALLIGIGFATAQRLPNSPLRVNVVDDCCGQTTALQKQVEGLQADTANLNRRNRYNVDLLNTTRLAGNRYIGDLKKQMQAIGDSCKVLVRIERDRTKKESQRNQAARELAAKEATRNRFLGLGWRKAMNRVLVELTKP
ncbi:hypothetical protein FAES_1815 [Fibrella aestuarina BUZ 2]|uniref:Uncharacterized protein n=1 Tax=Fibrella aestuarina BUZ 2 TaxID=1166018 RepID=I0K6S2_9BACT|nr:hypothetical protein [Fibrella aestuarina]CCG99825.1 hypothetical protein FAES_1815 [Fibrella aestuarina BUZ 2]